MGQPIKNPMFPFSRVASRFFQQTINQLEVNTMTQCIYPKEVYNGYAVVNQKRKDMGGWYSTGEGAKSFAGKIIEAGDYGKVTMAFEFNDYMRFVDMGVGQGTSYEDVDNARKARFQTRYITKCIDVILLDGSKEVLRKIYSSLIGLLNKIIIHRLLELLPGVSLTSDSKAHLSKSFIHTSLYRFYVEFLLCLIPSEAYCLG